LYLSAHGHHVRHLELSSREKHYYDLNVWELPANMQLESLSLQELVVWLLPVNDDDIGDYRGVLTGQTQLTKLRMHDCIAGSAGVAQALSRLPQLLHLDVAAPQRSPNHHFPFPGDSAGLRLFIRMWSMLQGAVLFWLCM
jgi:hypothetical protein